MNLSPTPSLSAAILAALALNALACDPSPSPPDITREGPANPNPITPPSTPLTPPLTPTTSQRPPSPLASSPVAPSPAEVEAKADHPPGVAVDPVEAAIRRGAAWLEVFPEDGLRFDAALMLSEAREALEAAGEGVAGANVGGESVGGEGVEGGGVAGEGVDGVDVGVEGRALASSLDGALARARRRADRDADHPHRRLWAPELELGREAIQGWSLPVSGQARVNPNGPLSEAIFCDRYPMRREAMAYIAGPMRDSGGFHATHAAWAWAQLRRRGCVAPARYARVAEGMIEELRAAQVALSAASPTREVDLFAERLMALGVLGAEGLEGDVGVLLAAQRPDGGWGAGTDEEAAYWRYHATAASVWALSVARSRGVRGPRSWPGSGPGRGPEPGPGSGSE